MEGISEPLRYPAPAAQLVHWVDKFEMALQAKTYESQGYPSSILQQFFTSTIDGIDGNDVLLLLEHTKEAFFSK